jgi:hypothetical protein
MYTANTMAVAAEALGMSLPYSSSYPANSPEKLAECYSAGAAIRNLLVKDIKPKDIMTLAAFKNAIVITMVTSTHTLSIHSHQHGNISSLNSHVTQTKIRNKLKRFAIKMNFIFFFF